MIVGITNCDSNQVTTVVEHNGACWRAANFDEGDCSQRAGERSGKYDCADPWIAVKNGDGETDRGPRDRLAAVMTPRGTSAAWRAASAGSGATVVDLAW